MYVTHLYFFVVQANFHSNAVDYKTSNPVDWVWSLVREKDDLQFFNL